MRVTQRPQGDTSDEEVTRPVPTSKSLRTKQDPALDEQRFATAVRAVWARPSISKVAGNNAYTYRRVCAICNRFDPGNTCEGSILCQLANNAVSTPLGRVDMRLSRDVTGTGVGTNIYCFRCGVKGHFARDCPQQTTAEREARGSDPLVQLAIADRDRKPLASSPTRSVPQMQKAKRAPQTNNFVQRNRMERRGRSRSPPRSSRGPEFENGRWRDLDLTPKNGSSGRARDSRW